MYRDQPSLFLNGTIRDRPSCGRARRLRWQSDRLVRSSAIAGYRRLRTRTGPTRPSRRTSSVHTDTSRGDRRFRHRCADADQDGSLDLATECAAWHEFVLPLPSEASRRSDIPFKWALVNWNPHGHIPPGVWDEPHFDVHFSMERFIMREAAPPATAAASGGES